MGLSTPLAQHVMDSLQLKDIRLSTRQTYLRTLRPFMDLDFDSLNVPELNDILQRIPNQNTRRKTVIALKSCIDHPAVKALKFPESVPRLYDLPDESTLRLALMTSPHETRGLLMMYCGLRIGEACAVTKDDLQGNMLKVTRQMDGYTREIRPVKSNASAVPVPDFLVPAVALLGPLEVSPKAVRKALLNAGKRVGIHLNPHMLRTWYCNRLIKMGLPPHVVQRLMRHGNIRVTFTHYAQAEAADLASAVKDMGNLDV